MPESAEHQFLKSELDRILKDFSGTGLLGVFEADRQKFDYSCRLERDFSRPLVSQICWENVLGIHKDLEQLLIGSNAPVKLYILPDKQKARLRLDEALARYRDNPGTRPLLKGLRYLALPSDFDADNDAARAWIAGELKRRICSDLLFGAIFGRLRAEDVTEFAQYMGPEGLKFALLNGISQWPLASILDVKISLGISSSKNSIREALVMLRATGLLYQKAYARSWHPTVKGRFL
ncbi:MAG: hypothetical protein JOY83_10815 [Alphaproteobacteria bacterium]|nr:hypothetical protein [Alphaproteobacteria bacterium]